MAISLATSSDWLYAALPNGTIDSGWQGSAEFGAQVITGNSRSESLSAALSIDRRRDQIEIRTAMSILTNTVSLVRKKRDEQDEIVLDDDGDPVYEVVTGTAHELFSLETQSRWYQSETGFLFTDLEYTTDNPDKLRYLGRITTGFGRKVRLNDHNELTAGFGIGVQRLSHFAGESVDDTIGYLSLSHVYTTETGFRFSAMADSNLDGDEPVAKVEFAASYPINEGLALALRYQMRYHSHVENDDSPLASERDSTTTINLEVVLF